MVCTSTIHSMYDTINGIESVEYLLFLFFDMIDMGVGAGLFWGLLPSSSSVRATLGLAFWVSGLIKILLTPTIVDGNGNALSNKYNIPTIKYEYYNPIWNSFVYIFNLFQFYEWFDYLYDCCRGWYQGDYKLTETVVNKV